jgi:WD40 repeat protein
MKLFPRLCALVAVALACGSPSPLTAQTKQPKKPPLQFLEETKFEIKRHVHAVAYSPDGKHLAVAEENVHLYDVSGEAPKEVTVFKSRVGFGICSVTFSPDGKKLAFGGRDHSVRVWDVEGQKEVFQSKDHRGDVQSVAYSPDGKFLATGSDDKTTILWDVKDDGKLVEKSVIKAEDKFGAAVKSVVFTQKGNGLVTACSNGTFRIYALGAAGVKQAGGFKGKNGFGDAQARSSPTGQLWAITDHKSVHMLNGSGTAVGVLEGHKEDVADVAFSPDGKLLATCGKDGTLHVWTVVGKGARLTKERPGKFAAVAWAPAKEGSADMTLAAALEDGAVWLLKVGTK